jgi:hypothetical protein
MFMAKSLAPTPTGKSWAKIQTINQEEGTYLKAAIMTAMLIKQYVRLE